MRMSASTIDRRLAGERSKMRLSGRWYTEPGSLDPDPHLGSVGQLSGRVRGDRPGAVSGRLQRPHREQNPTR